MYVAYLKLSDIEPLNIYILSQILIVPVLVDFEYISINCYRIYFSRYLSREWLKKYIGEFGWSLFYAEKK